MNGSIDQQLVSAFSWQGPENIPGNSEYNYEVWNDPTGQWMSVGGGGTVVQRWVGVNKRPGALVSWPAGGATLPVAFQASSLFSWNFSVNVVEIQLTITDAPDITCNGGQGRQIAPRVVVPYAAGNWAMSAQLSVDIIGAGPDNRGVSHIDMGFIQLITPTALRYQTATGPGQWVSQAQGATPYLDSLMDHIAWADPNSQTSLPESHAYFHSASDSEYADLHFSLQDRPFVSVSPAVLPQNGQHSPAWVPLASDMCHFSYQLFFAAHSLDADTGVNARIGPNNTIARFHNPYHYFQVASGAWQYDLSSRIVNGTWQPPPGVVNAASVARQGQLAPSTGIVPVIDGWQGVTLSPFNSQMQQNPPLWIWRPSRG